MISFKIIDLDRFALRLEGLKLKFLSLAGRRVLVQSVINSIPMYVMQTMLVHIGECNKLDQLMSHFI